ncbi:T-box transcription factor TBX19-like, partial [Ictalurus furcatus]|uniref:T-box transcription factor TBX19-like n=1 Tax=Ictalurus furcatus TaxID=66913 RepID=UPI0023510494
CNPSSSSSSTLFNFLVLSVVSLSEGLSPGALQVFSGHETWTGVSSPGPAAMLSVPSGTNSPGVSSQYPCLWTVSGCGMPSTPPGGALSSAQCQEERPDAGSTSPCSLLQGQGPTSADVSEQANHNRVGGASWSAGSTHSF